MSRIEKTIVNGVIRQLLRELCIPLNKIKASMVALESLFNWNKQAPKNIPTWTGLAKEIVLVAGQIESVNRKIDSISQVLDSVLESTGIAGIDRRPNGEDTLQKLVKYLGGHMETEGFINFFKGAVGKRSVLTKNGYVDVNLGDIPSSQISVLLVENDELSFKLMEGSLKDLGCVVYLAEDVKAFFSTIKEVNCDIIFLSDEILSDQVANLVSSIGVPVIVMQSKKGGQTIYGMDFAATVVEKPVSDHAIRQSLERYVSPKIPLQNKAPEEIIIDLHEAFKINNENGFVRIVLDSCLQDFEKNIEVLKEGIHKKDPNLIAKEIQDIRGGGICYLKMPQMEQALILPPLKLAT